MEAEVLGSEEVEETLSVALLAELGGEHMSYEGATEAKAYGLSTWQVESALRSQSMTGWVAALEEYSTGLAGRFSDP